jgi:hypothetical protein
MDKTTTDPRQSDRRITETADFASWPSSSAAQSAVRTIIPEWLLRRLTKHSFDGSEVHGVVERELRGPENEIAASAIRHAIVAQYRETIPVDAVVEIIAELLDKGEPA